MKKRLKYILALIVVLIFFYFFSFSSVCYFFNYYRALHYGITVAGNIDSKPCHLETSSEYSPEEYCDINYSFYFNNKDYRDKIGFIKSSKCENIFIGPIDIAFMKSNPEQSYIIDFPEYSLSWTITKFLISIIVIPLCLLFLYAHFFKNKVDM